jgi:drug/metabolite transporter (DMT)-like permease
MSIGDASFLSPLDYLRLPMSAVADFWVFRLIPGASIWIGAAIIVVSTLYIGWRERVRGVSKS